MQILYLLSLQKAWNEEHSGTLMFSHGVHYNGSRATAFPLPKLSIIREDILESP
jgi:hypothetical protein